MNILDITFDLETTALTPNAAVMSLGAVAWDREGLNNAHNPFAIHNIKKDEYEKDYHFFERYIDLRSQFVNGFDFDQNTAKWWSNQKTEAKHMVSRYSVLGVSLETALVRFFEWAQKLCKDLGYETYNLWCQGTDFDVAIIKNAYSKLLPDAAFPVNRIRLRDARTYILEAGLVLANICDQLDASDLEKNPNLIYKYIPKLPEDFMKGYESVQHTSIYDAMLSSWNVFVLMGNMNYIIANCDNDLGFPVSLLKEPLNNH